MVSGGGKVLLVITRVLAVVLVVFMTLFVVYCSKNF
jgi:hypothetical protein